MEEEEITYAKVVFKNSNVPPQETNEEDKTIYSTLKHERKELVSTAATEGDAATHSKLLLSGLGLLCVLLVASIAVLAYVMVMMKEQQENLDDLAAENERASVENRILMNRTKQLSRERDDLNRTLKAILTFDNFPVKDYCPGRKCQPCRKDWILYQQKCYLFYDKNPWMTWERSRQYCRNTAADLVVIDDLQEQEFISNHSKFYYDEYHGYWLGLREINKKWLWVDGRNDTLGYWIRGAAEREQSFTLMIPQRKPTESWKKVQNWFLNRFICEAEALQLVQLVNAAALLC